jgi:pSer/pThr/pTyr-binding forkhead associated (FHA) protein
VVPGKSGDFFRNKKSLTLENIKTIGRLSTCDLALNHPSVSRVHAQVERSDDGRLSVQDNGSANGTFLFRQSRWIRVERVNLHRDDLLRLGGLEVPVKQLTGMFGPANRVWLPAISDVLNMSGIDRSIKPEAGGDENKIRKPRRNPVTGQIEEHYT